MLKDKLTQDIKTAMLAGNKAHAEVLKSLKSAILYEEVALKVREQGLPDDKILTVLARESKKRGESATQYQQAGADDRAQTELSEKAIIDEYLPKQMANDELDAIVATVIAEQNADMSKMGQVIGAVKAKVGPSADGARVAAAVKAKLAGS